MLATPPPTPRSASSMEAFELCEAERRQEAEAERIDDISYAYSEAMRTPF